MEKRYYIGKVAPLRNELKQILKDVEEGKIDNAKAADEIMAIRERIEKIIQDLNSSKHE